MKFYVALALSCFASVATFADEGALAPDNLVYCTTCHGTQLMGNEVLAAPRLSGMSAWYVQKQLLAFKAGWRGMADEDEDGNAMMPIALSLSDSEIGVAADWVSRTRSPILAVSGAGDAGAGRALFTTCAACHGATGAGNEQLGAPSLLGQNDWYLTRQLINFRDGVRGSHPDDITGRQMQAAMAGITDDRQIADLVAYIMLGPEDAE